MVVGGGVFGGGGCCCWMMLSHIPLTQVGDSSPAGRAPGQSGECDSHQSKFTFFISPTNLFLFKHHFFFSGTQRCLALITAARCVKVCVCVCAWARARFNPLLPKDLFFVKVDFSWGGEPSLFCVFFSGACDVGRPRPRRIWSNLCLQCRHGWLFALFQFFNYVSSGG